MSPADGVAVTRWDWDDTPITIEGPGCDDPVLELYLTEAQAEYVRDELNRLLPIKPPGYHPV